MPAEERVTSRPMMLDGTVVLGDGRAPSRDVPWRGTFHQPTSVFEARRPGDVASVVARADAAARAGAWAVVVLSYDAAPAADPALRVRDAEPGLLAWAATYHGPASRPLSDPVVTARAAAGVLPAVSWTPALDQAEFATRLATLHAHIAAGDTYQVNYTFPLHGQLEPEAAWDWYDEARRRAQVPFAAWIARADDLVLSLSPELFFLREGERIVTRPMKGTQARGRWTAEDAAARAQLLTSEKARAENVMIVDLLRNDLGRLALPGSVRVTDLCRVERYPTVWQMTSTIEARVVGDPPLWQLIEALFPCGSVTGAPKVRTMALIAEHEVTSRGVYTGAIGLIRPGGDCVLSVPIRTITVDRLSGRATLGVGAGITADSDPAEEYAECLVKAQAAQARSGVETSGLFETLRLEEGRVWLRDGHLRRLADSAALLDLPCDGAAAAQALDACVAAYPSGVWRVRLVLSADGALVCAAEPYRPLNDVWRVALSREPVTPADRRLFHKTLDRRLYESARASRPDADEVLLWTAEGALTEATRANLVVQRDGVRWTPPVSSGLLPGVYRHDLLARGRIRERTLTRADLAAAEGVWLINSLRGWIRITVELD